MLKLISWNVNGLRAACKKGFEEFFLNSSADVFCIQETKLQEDQINFRPGGYYSYWNSAIKKGYSGTAVFTKKQPERVAFGMQIEEHDNEGRIITADYGNFYLVNVYTPNSKRGLARLDYRMKWEDDFISFLNGLSKDKPTIICGDLNVAHEEIDIKHPKSNRRNAGFTDEERQKMTDLLSKGFVDTFRFLYPDLEGAYSWWSYMGNARENNSGWRIDYFIASAGIKDKIKGAQIHSDIFGSDHCPVSLEIDI